MEPIRAQAANALLDASQQLFRLGEDFTAPAAGLSRRARSRWAAPVDKAYRAAYEATLQAASLLGKVPRTMAGTADIDPVVANAVNDVARAVEQLPPPAWFSAEMGEWARRGGRTPPWLREVGFSTGTVRFNRGVLQHSAYALKWSDPASGGADATRRRMVQLASTPHSELTQQHLAEAYALRDMLPHEIRPLAAAPYAYQDLRLSSTGYSGTRPPFRELEGLAFVNSFPTPAAAWRHLDDLLAAPPESLGASEQTAIRDLVYGLHGRYSQQFPFDRRTLSRILDYAPWSWNAADFETARLTTRRTAYELLSQFEPQAFVREIGERLAQGPELDMRMVSALSGVNPALLAQAGLDPAVIHVRALSALSRAGDTHPRDVGAQLALVRARLASVTSDDPAALTLRDDTLTMVNRNVARIDGTRSDTYGNHPDYAEIGRIVANGQLLDAMLRPGATSAARRTAGSTAEHLVW